MFSVSDSSLSESREELVFVPILILYLIFYHFFFTFCFFKYVGSIYCIIWIWLFAFIQINSEERDQYNWSDHILNDATILPCWCRCGRRIIATTTTIGCNTFFSIDATRDIYSLLLARSWANLSSVIVIVVLTRFCTCLFHPMHASLYYLLATHIRG